MKVPWLNWIIPWFKSLNTLNWLSWQRLFIKLMIEVSTAASKTLSENRLISIMLVWSNMYFLMCLYSIFEYNPSGNMNVNIPFSFSSLCPFSKNNVKRLNLPAPATNILDKTTFSFSLIPFTLTYGGLAITTSKPPFSWKTSEK